MKRIFALLIAILCIALVACSGNKKNDDKDDDDDDKTNITSSEAVSSEKPEESQIPEYMLNDEYTSESGKYRIVFKNDGTCKWYQDNTFFLGEYSFANNQYTLEIVGSSYYKSSVFTAVIDGEDLIITGGVVNGERFIKTAPEV